MQKTFTSKTLLALMALLFASGLTFGTIGVVTRVQAQQNGIFDRARTQYFNNGSLNGRYASLSTAITPGTPASNKTTYDACVGLVTFDGFGNFTDSETHSFNGEIERAQYKGTYQVNPDGTGTMTYFDENGPTDPCPIILSDGGREVTFIITTPGIVATGVLKKQ